MKKKYVYYCNPDEKGKFNWEKLTDLLKLPFIIWKWGRTKATFEKYVPRKTLKQLGYYRGGILPYLEDKHRDQTQWTERDWHNNLKEQFGVKKVSSCGSLVTSKSHADYTEQEMMHFIDKVRNFSIETLKDEIPAPLHIGDYI